MEKKFENFTATVLKLNKLVQKIKAFEMRSYGLKAVHVMCIYYLDVKKQGLTASELVKLTLEDKAAISRALALMREKGLVNYNPKEYNAKITLTEDGKNLAESINSKAAEAVKKCGFAVTEEESKQFFQSLETVAEKLQVYYNTVTGDSDVEDSD